MYVDRGEYEKGVDYLEKAIAFIREVGFKNIELFTASYLYLTYKHLSRAFDKKIIRSLG